MKRTTQLRAASRGLRRLKVSICHCDACRKRAGSAFCVAEFYSHAVVTAKRDAQSIADARRHKWITFPAAMQNWMKWTNPYPPQ